MEYRRLGRTDIEVSVLALGCWPFAGGKVWGPQDDGVSIATVHAALDAGITLFDSAEGYEAGHSERVLGEGLKGRRGEAVIATKASASNLSAEGIERACEQSLKNLQTDAIDLYQIHWPGRGVPIEETLRTLDRLVQQGKVRAVGVSNFGAGDLSDLLKAGRCETDQLPYSLLWRAIEDAILPMCIREGIGVICYSPLMQGLLTGRYRSADEVPEGLARTRIYAGSRPMAQHGEPGCEAEVFAALDRVREIAREIGEPMAAVALAWVRQQPGVTSLLVGARTPDEVRQNLRAADLILSQETVRRLAQATEEVKRKLGPNPDMWMSESRYR